MLPQATTCPLHCVRTRHKIIQSTASITVDKTTLKNRGMDTKGVIIQELHYFSMIPGCTETTCFSEDSKHCKYALHL